MTYQTLNWSVEDHILTLTLNRPTQMNSFTVEMANELIHAYQQASTDADVRAIVLTGAGKAFCAGMDLSKPGNVFGLDESLKPSLDDIQHLDDPAILHGVRDTGGRVTLAMFNCTKPIIAAINGAAVGIGATMTLAADVRLASEKARIGFVFGKIGIVPEACSSWFLPRIVGISQALEWCYSADILSPQEALQGRLVKAVYAPEDLLPQAYALAQKFVQQRSPVAVALARQMLYRNSAQAHPVEAHKIDSLAMFYTSLQDGKEGVQSFLDKREAAFSAQVPQDLPPFYQAWAV
jgi:enoyl-CoA hydratase/carnithine racemase